MCSTRKQEKDTKFCDQDISWLLQLLVTAEKRKWKAITKEINNQSPSNRQCHTPLEAEHKGGARAPHKNVSPTYVTKQFHNLFGMPQKAHRYGILGSSLPYAVAVRGWSDIMANPVPSANYMHEQKIGP